MRGQKKERGEGKGDANSWIRPGVHVFSYVFTVLHEMQARSSDENSVRLSRLSVCPSVKRVNCDKTEEKSVQIFTPYERTFNLVFREKEWLVGVTLST